MQKEHPPEIFFNSRSAFRHVVNPKRELECSVDSDCSRRFLQASLALSSFIALPAYTRSSSTTQIELDRTFFSRDEYRFIAAAIARKTQDKDTKDISGDLDKFGPRYKRLIRASAK